MTTPLLWAESARSGGGLLTVLSTGLNALANNAAAQSATISNDASDEGDRFFEAVLDVTYGTAPVADTECRLYVVRAIDGTNYEDASASRPPANGYVGSFILDNVNTAQRKTIPPMLAPRGEFQLLLVNAAGQAMSASGHTLQIRFFTEAY